MLPGTFPAALSLLVGSLCFSPICSPVRVRALREALCPTSGAAQLQVHKVAAAYIMRAFDLEHPNSGILDADEVAVGYKRHVYRMESTFVAGELREIDRNAELTIMAHRLFHDPRVMSGTLEPAPVPSGPDTNGILETPSEARKLLGAGVIEAKKSRTKASSVGGRVVKVDDGTSWKLPWGIYHVVHAGNKGGPLGVLRMLISLYKGTCLVNGMPVAKRVAVRVERSDINKRTVLALRSATLSLELWLLPFCLYGCGLCSAVITAASAIVGFNLHVL